jgi:hypothetical protein
MNRNSNNPKELSAYAAGRHLARNHVPGWRTVVIALILVLAIQGVGQIPPAQAASVSGDPISIGFTLEVFPENPPTLRCKQKFPFYVGVSKTKYKTINDKAYEIPDHVGAPKATGEVTGPKIGTLAMQIGASDDNSGDYTPVSTTNFIFTADKPGTTTIKFTAFIRNSWIGANEQVVGSTVKVETEITVKISCKEKVTTIGEYHASGPAHVFVAATSGDAVVIADDQGSYRGSTTVNWVASASGVGNCSGAVIEIGSSGLDWTGQMGDSDQLTLNGTYLPAHASVSVSCGTSGTRQLQITPDAVQVSMTSSGGVLRQSQSLQGQAPAQGSVTIIVVPQEDKAAAFNTDNYEARVSSPFYWWAMLSGNDFPRLDRALLTLR